MTGLLSAQNGYKLQLSCNDKPADFFSGKLAYKSLLKDSLQAKTELEMLAAKLRSQGYAGVSVDSLVKDSVQTVAYIYVGEKVQAIVVANGNVEENLLGYAGLKNKIGGDKTVSVSGAELIKARLLRECENRGYPFAVATLDSFTYQQNRWTARLYLEKNDLIKIDTVRIVGKTKVKRVFLKNYLGLKTRKPYNESNIKRITQRLNELQFIQAVQPHTVEFQDGKASVNLFLKDKKASQFTALVGFLPGSSGQRLLVTGDALIHLFSPFGMGEEFFLQWQKLQPKTQRLDVRFSYPYIAGLPLGVNARFELYKRDTSWLDLDGDYGIRYQIIGSNYLQASLRQKTTIILNVDTALIKSRRALPQNLDISANEFALEYFVQKLDYRFNPVSGYVFRVSGGAGAKTIRRNNVVANLFDEQTGRTFNFLYDTTRLRTFQFRIALSIEKYWRLAARHTIKTSFDGRYFFSRNIFENEKYRLGGPSSLRGFDDQSIFTPYYAMGNVEYRFLLQKNSYFHTFFNAAMVQDVRPGKGPFDFPFGFGAGAAIETKAGVFGITYAMGRQLDNKLTFRDSKIHFGYVNFF